MMITIRLMTTSYIILIGDQGELVMSTSQRHIKVEKIECPDAGAYQGCCEDGTIYGYSGHKHKCGECDGLGYIYVINKQDILDLISNSLKGEEKGENSGSTCYWCGDRNCGGC